MRNNLNLSYGKTHVLRERVEFTLMSYEDKTARYRKTIYLEVDSLKRRRVLADTSEDIVMSVHDDVKNNENGTFSLFYKGVHVDTVEKESFTEICPCCGGQMESSKLKDVEITRYSCTKCDFGWRDE
jgi:hypothetical protein